MNIKRLFSLLIALLMVTSAFLLAGCNKEPETPVDTSNVGDVTDADTGIVFPSRNYGGEEFRILCTTQCHDLYKTDEEATTVIAQESLYRNLEVEDKYGVELTFTPMEGRSAGSSAFVTAIRTASMTNDTSYDLVIGQTYYTMALALEGLYYNMATSEYLNLDQAWYDKELVNDNIELGGKLYALSGSYVISQVTTAMGLYYNKTIFEAKGFQNDLLGGNSIYNVVKEGNWTYELMYQMVTQVYSDEDNSSSANANDIYGFVGNLHAKMCALIGSDTPFTTINEDGTLSVSGYYNDHLIKVFESYFTFFNDTDSVYFVGSDEGLIEFFANGQALFCCNAIEYLAQSVVRDSGIDYGVLPFPKYTADQTDYYTNNIRWEVAHIPAACDTERATIIFEYLNYLTYTDFIPVYFDEILALQVVPTQEDSDMLYMIRENILYDFTTFYQAQIGISAGENIYTGVRNLLNTQTKDIASWWSTNKDLYDQCLNDLVETYLYFLE